MAKIPELRHRMTYYSRRIEPAEIRVYTAEDGERLIIKSTHQTLRSVEPNPCRYTASDSTVHAAVDIDGTEGYVIKAKRSGGKLVRESHIPGKSTTYIPMDEWGHLMGMFYPSMEDALIVSGDRDIRAQEHARLDEQSTQADQAATAADGSPSHVWSRKAYEAACAALGLDAADEETARHGRSGVYTIPEYHREHVLWTRMLHNRMRGIAAEREAADKAAQDAVDEAAGTGPYSREQYESACAVVSITPIPDTLIAGVLDDHYLGSFRSVRDVMGEMRSANALGELAETAAMLATRRQEGMGAELKAVRQRERQKLIEQGHEFATPAQVKKIMGLLADRAREGIGGGFYIGPTDHYGVANMAKEEASLYITSLSEEY